MNASAVLFLFNVFINSFFSFFTVLGLIELFIFLLRIKEGRVRAFLHMLPIFKLPLDLFLYDFSTWSYMQGVNPLLCEKGTRALSAMISVGNPSLFFPIKVAIQLFAPGATTFTLADLVSYCVPFWFLVAVVGVVGVVSCGALVKKGKEYAQWHRKLSELKKTRRQVACCYIKRLGGKQQIPVFVSSTLLGSPFLSGLVFPAIYFPESLYDVLTQDEYEAVLAHESEHVRYQDLWLRLGLDWMGVFFWWVPKKWVYRKIEEGQEIGCDRHCRRYGVDPLDLASALARVAHRSKRPLRGVAEVSFFAKQSIVRRVRYLVSEKERRLPLLWGAFCWLGCIGSFFIGLLGRFWIF